MSNTTIRDVPPDLLGAAEPRPGVVHVYTTDRPAWGTLAIEGKAVALGREGSALPLADAKLSRKHATVSHARGLWKVTDLGSTNGTFVDGARVEGAASYDSPAVLRIGGSLFLFMDDVTPFEATPTHLRQGTVVGAQLSRAFRAIELAARGGDHLHVRGESGTGKEVAARLFHASSLSHRGPFVAINCATIPHGVADRLLFGARKGAYSGADQDAEGLVQAADGGTLFLDEIAELELAVQAKLLRVLESREVLALGATKPRPVDVRICSATHADLRVRIAAGAFREDLYFRVGRPEVELPPLRERLEEVPMLIDAEVRQEKSVADASFVEACLRRAWPGNVRELLGEVRAARAAAQADGRTIVAASDLSSTAGLALGGADAERPGTGVATVGAGAPDDDIATALRAEAGNVSRAAARLGIHRNRIRRWIEKHRVDPKGFRDA